MTKLVAENNPHTILDTSDALNVVYTFDLMELAALVAIIH
jgi:hypothetical protein